MNRARRTGKAREANDAGSGLKPKRQAKDIASWRDDERPREWLLSRGPQSLTDAELVAMLIGVGFRGTSTVELSRGLLKRFGSLRGMVEVPVIALSEAKGLKSAKEAQLPAAIEIASRVALPVRHKKLQFKSTSIAAAHVTERLRGLSEEHFRVLHLNPRSALVDNALTAQGRVGSVRPPYRKVVARAPQVKASALIAAHNHSSVTSEPSESDRLLTKDLISALRPLGLRTR